MFHEQSGLHLFTWRGIDVFVSMWYLILMAMMVFLNFGGTAGMLQGVILALAVTFTLLIHEFGHALVSQRYKLRPTILLHGFGGVCRSDQAATDRQDAHVLLAGPLAGLAGAALLFGLKLAVPAVGGIAIVGELVGTMIWLGVVWNLFNLLLPIWPLDGGQLFHLILRRFTTADKAQNIALHTSIALAIPVGILGFVLFKTFFLAFMCLFIVMDNLNVLRNNASLVDRSSGRDRSPASGMKLELMMEAEAALEAGDWREAARLGHQMRALGRMPDAMMGRVWTILGLAHLEMGEVAEAQSYLKRAPDGREVREALARCEERQSA